MVYYEVKLYRNVKIQTTITNPADITLYYGGCGVKTVPKSELADLIEYAYERNIEEVKYEMSLVKKRLVDLQKELEIAEKTQKETIKQ